MTLLTRRPSHDGVEAEALIKEAKALRRRRRTIGTFVVVVAVALVVALVLAFGVARPARNPTPSSASRNRPSVDVRAFRNEGRLAFVSRNAIWIVDGRAGVMKELPTIKGYSPGSPQFSRDGKWLAYLETRTTNDATVSNVWIARGNGTDAREVARSVGAFTGWSSARDLLTVVSTTPVKFASGTLYPVPSGVELIAPSGNVRELVSFPTHGEQSVQVSNAVWSPGGDAVAVSTSSGGRDGGTSVRSYPIAGGSPTTWFSIRNSAILPGVCTGCGGRDAIADLAGWWPGWGIGFWVFSSGMTHNNDDTPIELVTGPRATLHIIGDTLSDGTTVAFSSDPNGELAIVASTGGREYGAGKTVDVCRRSTETCEPIPGASVWSSKPLPCVGLECSQVPAKGTPGSAVSIDPSWSPNGSLLAYEKAPTVPDDGVPNHEWYAAHVLYLWSASTNSSRKVAVLQGATVPIWSKNGEELLYVANNALWLWQVNTAQPLKVASPLLPPRQWMTAEGEMSYSYYEQVNFHGQFSWWSR